MYCVKCRKKTENAEPPVMVVTRNNRNMLTTRCAVCGTKKNQFVKK